MRISVREDLRKGPVLIGTEALEPRLLMAGDAVLDWNDVLLDAIRAERTTPPVAARNMAIVHAAVFDAVNAIEGGYAPYIARRQGRKNASPEAAAAAAAHRTLVELFPARKAVFDAELAESLAGVPDGPGEKAAVALGRSVAQEVFASRRHDGSEEVVAYTPGFEPDDWQPTPPALAPALLPQWPGVTPFAMSSGSQFRPDGPPAITGEEFAAAFQRVKELGSMTSASRTTEQTQIARFWADGAGTATPPGHWNVIAQDVAEERGNSLAENARLFALLNIALADAAIVSWDAKYEFNLCRPLTAIRAADADGNPLTEADLAWTPLIATPPFPAYTSGHSTFSAAAATVLASFFGTDQASFTTSSDGLPGVTRAFSSFWQAAEEAGVSRIYGGIHWDFDNLDGLSSGRQLGQFVYENFLAPTSTGGGPGPVSGGSLSLGLGPLSVAAVEASAVRGSPPWFGNDAGDLLDAEPPGILG